MLSAISGIILGLAIYTLYGVLPSSLQTLFESIASFIAVLVLTSIIIWMAKIGGRIKEEIERKVEKAIRTGTKLAFLSTSFVVVFREALETVLFLTPFVISETVTTITGIFGGVIIAILLSYVIYKLGMKLNIKKFFLYTSIIIILIAGGLAGYGTHELIEYLEITGVDVGWFGKKAYDLPIDKDNPFHHKNVIGSILAVMFGYTTSAEVGRIIVHLTYLAIALSLIIKAYKIPTFKNRPT